MNVPNTLTTVRIVLVPVLVIVFYLPFEWASMACAAIFAIAAVTDWADGYLARRLSQVSTFGAFLDPVADKLMVAVALVLLLHRDPTLWLALPAAIIISRENRRVLHCESSWPNSDSARQWLWRRFGKVQDSLADDRSAVDAVSPGSGSDSGVLVRNRSALFGNRAHDLVDGHLSASSVAGDVVAKYRWQSTGVNGGG